MGKQSLKVDKTKFDNLLRKIAGSGPVKKSEVKIEKRKPAKIISAPKPTSQNE